MFVVKVGGSSGIDYDGFLEDLASHKDWVLLHGGSHRLNELSEQLGHPPQFVESPSGFTSRYTDRETLEMIDMVYPGLMNKKLVEKLQKMDVDAFGFSGLDGRVLQCVRKSTLRAKRGDKTVVLRGEHSGMIKQVNVEPLRALIELGYSPVLTIPAAAEDGTAVNVDGDRAAAEVARALEAETLIILSNVPGLLRDPADPTSLVESLKRAEIDRHIEEYAQGRMKKKLLGVKEALAGGVKRVVLGDGTVESPLSKAFEGEGTIIE